jgi:hypothetical protein
MPPGTRKSSEWKRAIKMLIYWEQEMAEAFMPKIARAKSEEGVIKEKIKAKKKEVTKAKTADDQAAIAEEIVEMEENLPLVPDIPRVLADDITPECLGTVMSKNASSAAVISAEGGIFEIMAGRYSQGTPNFDLYLKSHAADPVRIDRTSKSPESMDDPRLTMALAVQPDVLQSLSEKPGFRGRGLIGRFLFVYPPDNLGERSGNGPPMDDQAEERYQRSVRELIDLTRAEDAPQRTLVLSDEAAECWSDYSQEIERELPEGGRFDHMRDWAGKAPGAAARIAALFHSARHGGDFLAHAVSRDDMIAAIATCRALEEHALYTFDVMQADEMLDGARTVLRWIERHCKESITAREVYQGHKSRFPRMRDLEPVLDLLEERGWIRRLGEVSRGRGRPSRTYAVNPAVFGVFGVCGDEYENRT